MFNLTSKWFKKWAKKAKINDSILLEGIQQINSNNAANLGGGVYKIRIARKSSGKSGGFRTILIYKKGHLAFFIFGFPKNDRANIKSDELDYFKKQAGQILSMKNNQIELAIRNGIFIKLEDKA